MNLKIRSEIWREILGEFIGTFVMMLLSNGAAAQTLLSKGTHGQFFELKWATGLSVMMGIALAGGVSGAHINPAVTLGLACSRQFPWRKIPAYFLGQYLGSFLSSAIIYFVYLDALTLYSGSERLVEGANATASIWATFPMEGISHGTGILDQIVGTGLLLLCVRAIVDPQNLAIPKHLMPIMIGFLVLNISLAFGLNCANAINPARDFAPRLFLLMSGYGPESFSAYNYYFYIPIIGPHIGGILGSLLYDIFVYLHWPAPKTQL